MDTGNIMENQMQQQYEAAEALQQEICEQAIELYKKHQITPLNLLDQLRAQYKLTVDTSLALLNDRNIDSIRDQWNEVMQETERISK